MTCMWLILLFSNQDFRILLISALKRSVVMEQNKFCSYAPYAQTPKIEKKGQWWILPYPINGSPSAGNRSKCVAFCSYAPYAQTPKRLMQGALVFFVGNIKL